MELRRIILLALIIGLTTISPAFSQVERKLKIKTYDTSKAEAIVSISDKIGNKESFLSINLGYGTLLSGSGFYNPKTNWGEFGSGLSHSNLSKGIKNLGLDYIPKDNSWGRNGLNFSFDSKIFGVSMGGLYSGYNNIFSFNINTTSKNTNIKGIVIGRDGKVEELRTDIDISF